jgi:integrase
MIHLEKTKSGKPRWIPINDDLLAVLRLIPRHVGHDRVFTYRGQPIDSVKRSWEQCRTLAGVQARFHDLRHTWASRMVMAGVDLFTLMDLGGWSSVAMVRRYAHFAPEYRIKAAQLVNGTAGQVVARVAG